MVAWLCLLLSHPVWSEGTAAGTVIENTATASFDLGGVNTSQDSNTVTIVVLERLDVVVTLQSPQVVVSPGQTATSLLFNVSNTGNGDDEFRLAINSALAGDDFDPVPAVPAIYFDSDSSGDFSAGDVPYVAGSNDPQLSADESIDVLLVNDIPGNVPDNALGRSELTATSTTGTGLPGATLTGLGDGGVDAIVGASGGTAAMFGEYLAADVQISMLKSVTVSDPLGGTEPTVGATLTYTITLAVLNTDIATASVFSDPIPNSSTYVANSIFLNGDSLTDAVDTDEGELVTAGAPAIQVRLGDLTSADGIQTIEFQVTID